jgi:hypothetical protein
MKKIATSLIVSAAMLASSAAFAETPAVREMNSFPYILKLAAKSRAAGASEFVIYHQDHPCPPKGMKGKHHEGKKAGKAHHGKKHHHDHGKKADQKKTDDNTGK